MEMRKSRGTGVMAGGQGHLGPPHPPCVTGTTPHCSCLVTHGYIVTTTSLGGFAEAPVKQVTMSGMCCDVLGTHQMAPSVILDV